MNVRDVMTEAPATVAASSTTWEAAELLQTLEIRHLPVVEDGALVGILSDRDLDGTRLPMDQASLDQAMVAGRRPVSEVMSTHVITISPEAPLREVAEAMLENRVGALPVVENGDVLGIVSYVDVLRAAADRL